MAVLLEVVARESVVGSKVFVYSGLHEVKTPVSEAGLVILNPELLPIEAVSSEQKFSEALANYFPQAIVLCCASKGIYPLPRSVYFVDISLTGFHFLQVLKVAFQQVGKQLIHAGLKRKYDDNDFFNARLEIDVLELLSSRQQVILAMSSEGMVPTEIATVLGVSVNTIRGHIQETFSRLGAKNIAHAVAMYTKARMACHKALL